MPKVLDLDDLPEDSGKIVSIAVDRRGPYFWLYVATETQVWQLIGTSNPTAARERVHAEEPE